MSALYVVQTATRVYVCLDRNDVSSDRVERGAFVLRATVQPLEGSRRRVHMLSKPKNHLKRASELGLVPGRESRNR